MIRRALVFLATVITAFLSVPAASASTSTVLSMTFTDAGRPMANASVSVYYYPFDEPDTGFTLQWMGSGTTNLAGAFSAALDTSMVQTSSLGDDGTGSNDAFNAVVYATDSSGHFAVQHVILHLNAATSDSASAITDPVTATAYVATPNTAGTVVVPSSQLINTSYRYVKILAMNSGYGLKTKLTYTWTSSTAKQTDIGTALSVNGGSFSANGQVLEETNREVDAPLTESGSYHRYVWANYKFYEYQWYVCNHYYCNVYHEWVAHHFAGQVSDWNPNRDSSGNTIGYVAYDQPAFTPCSGNCYFIMYSTNSGWGRNSGTRHSYGWTLGVAGFITLGARATYGSITSTHWYYESGCSKKRVIWGYNTDPSSAEIVQANCINP